MRKSTATDRRYADEDMLLNATEAAEFLRASRVKIYRLARSGALRAHKVGNTLLFYLRDLHACVDGQQVTDRIAGAPKARDSKKL